MEKETNKINIQAEWQIKQKIYYENKNGTYNYKYEPTIQDIIKLENNNRNIKKKI